MKIQTSTVQKLSITEIDHLDPITVIMEDIAPQQGKIIIECYGKSWSAFWGGMGDRTIAQFFCGCDQDYLANKLSSIRDQIEDFDALVNVAKSEVLTKRKEGDIDASDARELYEKCSFLSEGGWQNQDLMQEIFGDDWFIQDIVPQKSNPDYQYLCRIIKTVQQALAA